MNIRVARQLEEAGSELPIAGPGGFQSTLILAPPGAGKTTLLRELCRRLSERFRVAVADERYEIAACSGGAPRFHIGQCDIMSGGKKRETIPMLLRSMSPQILAVDEITEEEDCRSLLSCLGCGCQLLATAHGSTLADLTRRPAYQGLLAAGAFRQVILIQTQEGCRSYTLQPMPQVL